MTFDRYFYTAEQLIWYVYNQTVNTDFKLEQDQTGRFLIKPKSVNNYPKNIYATGNLKNMLGINGPAIHPVNG